MVVADLDHERWLQRLPFRRSLGRPAARSTRRAAGEAGLADQLLPLLCERRLVLVRDVRCETNMVQQALVIQSKQQRADHLLSLVVTEAANHAVDAAIILDLLHAIALV